jgi:chemotaxis methyl-accepting protein methylase
VDPREFARLLDCFNLCDEGYRKVRRGVQKRIVRHMQQLGCPSLRDYLARIESDGDVREDARRLLDVSISRFFRDGDLWQALEANTLPSLVAGHPAGIRIWSAGCALGQEAYGIKMLWVRLTEGNPAAPPLDLFATDVNPAYLERAIEGVYPARAVAPVPGEARARFFQPAGKGTVRVADELRQGIRWQLHDLAAQPPPARDVHLLFLRNNLLTYYRKEIVGEALPAIVGSLAPGGVLVIGRKERLPGFLEGFDPHPAVPFLCLKRLTGGLA